MVERCNANKQLYGDWGGNIKDKFNYWIMMDVQ